MNINPYRFLLLGLGLLLAGPLPVYGTLIDFDDLPTRIDGERCEDWVAGSNCVDVEYQHLGVTFDGTMLYAPTPSAPHASLPNAVVNWSGIRFNLLFADWARPDYVSFDAWTTMMGGVYAEAYNENDELIAEVQVESDRSFPEDGYWSTLPPTSIAVTASDISRVEIRGVPGRRGNLHMDNVYFGDGPPAIVSEPSTAGLLMFVALALLRWSPVPTFRSRRKTRC